MAKKYPFRLDSEQDLIIVQAYLNGKYYVELALDTGATHTFVDFRALEALGLTEQDSQGEVASILANGSIQLYQTYSLKVNALGIEKDLKISSAYYEDPYGTDGVLGLDFFKNQKLVIDFQKFMIQVG
jgi:predicted aspartyl protease